jgi:hypothetical protein
MSAYDVNNKIIVYEKRDYISAESYCAVAAIKPGMLCLAYDDGTGSDLVRPCNVDAAANEPAVQRMFAVENGYEGKEIDDQYDIGDKVYMRIVQPGEIVLGWIDDTVTAPLARGTAMVSNGSAFLGYLRPYNAVTPDAPGSVVGYTYERIASITANMRVAVRIS